MSIGRKIKEIRLKRGMSVADFSRATGIDRAYLSRLEHDKIRSPQLPNLEKMADALRVDVADLMPSKVGVKSAAIPLIDADKAAGISGISDLQVRDINDWISTSSPSSFGLEVKDDRMAPEFTPGDLVVIDPEQKGLYPGYAFVRFNSEAAVVLLLKCDHTDIWHLRYLNPAYCQDECRFEGKDFSVVGRVVRRVKLY